MTINNCFNKNLRVLIALIFLSVNVIGQPLPCPPLNTTSVTGFGAKTICDGGSASIGANGTTSVKSTTDYTFSTIPYLPTTFTGGTPILVGTDDIYSGLVDLPFDFCFYGTKYNQCIIGANGTICFDLSLASSGDPWSISGPLPGGAATTATYNSIMGAYYDIDPSIPGSGGTNWAVYGTAPCRTFVVSWNHIGLFNTSFCPGLFGTQQIVLYESTYAIDVFIHEKPMCTGWNSGFGILGIQNADGTALVTAPGKNGTAWSVIDSGYRFTPNGPASWTYTWFDHSGAYVGSGSPITVSPTDTMTYTVKAVASSNCDSYTVYSSVFINIGANPVISNIVTTDPSNCLLHDGYITLHGLTPGLSDTIYYKSGGVVQPYIVQTSAGDSTLVIPGLGQGVYDSITVKVGECHSDPYGPFSLTDPVPAPIGIVAFTNPTECGKCNGSITLKSAAPWSSDTISYTYNTVVMPPFVTTAMGDSSIYLPGLCAGSYYNYSVKIGTCVVPVSGTAILVDPPLTAGFTHDSVLACHGDSVFFHNGSTTSPTGSLYYLWDFGDGSSDTVKNPVHVYPAGNYTVHLTATNHYCNSFDSTAFTLGHPLKAVFTETPDILCQGQTAVTTNSSIGATGYLWQFTKTASDTATNATYIYQRAGTYDLTLIAHNDIPCYDTAHKTVYVDTISNLNITLTDSVTCSGTYVTMRGLYAALGNTGITWVFGDNQTIEGLTEVKHAYANQGTYTITGTAHYRVCPEASATRTVTVFQQPSIDIGRDTSICIGSEAIKLNDHINKGGGVASWLWNTGEHSHEITITAPGKYYATVNINNCYTSDSIEVANDCYVNIPNAFTPNGDGINDYFFPRQYLSRGLTDFKMNIYNRWGQLLFETKSLEGAGWDGKLNGVDQPAGVYVYIIDASFKDGQQEHHQGNVTVLR